MRIFSHVIVFIISYLWIAFWFMASSFLWHSMMINNGFIRGLDFASNSGLLHNAPKTAKMDCVGVNAFTVVGLIIK